jgi:hypothetical protein
VLTSQPTGDVTIGLSSSSGEGQVSVASVTFTAANWNVAQTVTVTGQDDAIDDGDQAYTIMTAAATSSDANYTGLDAADVALTNTDNDEPPSDPDSPGGDGLSDDFVGWPWYRREVLVDNLLADVSDWLGNDATDRQLVADEILPRSATTNFGFAIGGGGGDSR